MKISQTLDKKLQKAIANGYIPHPDYKTVKFQSEVNRGGFGFVAFLLESDEKQPNGTYKRYQITFSIADVIFDQGFAKALWPGQACPNCGLNCFKSKSAKIEHDPADPACAAAAVDAWFYHQTQLLLLNSNKGRLNYIGSNA
jgi:hypothetical protein